MTPPASRPEDGAPRPLPVAPAAARRLHDVALRAYDLSEQAARLGLHQQRRRVQQWRSRLFMISQISVAAGTAWWLGQHLLGHPMPFFASVAAIICLGFSFGQRISRVVEVSCGVFIGVCTGDVFVALFGTGVWQIMLVCFVAMSLATWFNAKTLMINQSGIQAATVMTLLPTPGEGLDRWADALLGCALALTVALVAPTSPVQKPRIKAAAVLDACTATLRSVRDALLGSDEEQAHQALDSARATERALGELSDAAAEGVAVARYSPFLRGHRENVQGINELVAPLDRLTRNLRVLARRGANAAWRDEPVPFDYLGLMGELADVMEFCSDELAARRMPERARDRIVAFAERSSAAGLHGPLSGLAILAQMRSMAVDLLELTGLDHADARALVPDID